MRPIDADALVASLKESYKELRKLYDETKDGDGAKEVYQGELITFLEAILRAKNAPTLDYAPKWISVNDRLPDFGRSVLVCTYDGCMYVLELLKSFGVVFWGDENCACYAQEFVDYWMPLPEPPKEE